MIETRLLATRLLFAKGLFISSDTFRGAWLSVHGVGCCERLVAHLHSVLCPICMTVCFRAHSTVKVAWLCQTFYVDEEVELLHTSTTPTEYANYTSVPSCSKRAKAHPLRAHLNRFPLVRTCAKSSSFRGKFTFWHRLCFFRLPDYRKESFAQMLWKLLAHMMCHNGPELALWFSAFGSWQHFCHFLCTTDFLVWNVLKAIWWISFVTSKLD